MTFAWLCEIREVKNRNVCVIDVHVHVENLLNYVQLSKVHVYEYV
jgi:hypothetical protein